MLGILAVIPIGGADMPVVIALLNSYSGLAAAAAGFIIQNTVLIVAGCLVGASGIILTQIMCKAMNRSIANVFLPGLAHSSASAGEAVSGEAKAITPESAYFVLEAASQVVLVPGYGMAVAQAQHVLRELADLLEANGAEVRYAIHPVAGRMPGHMNVLLAEADVPYEQLVEMDAINPTIATMDVAIVIGANDVVNPAAREDSIQPDLRHADHQRRRSPHRLRPETLDGLRFRRNREPALLQAEHPHALRRRQSQPASAGRGIQGDLMDHGEGCSPYLRRKSRARRPRFYLNRTSPRLAPASLPRIYRTVSIAVLLVALPALLLTTTEKRDPLSFALAGGVM